MPDWSKHAKSVPRAHVWVGEIGWFEGDYFERYGGSAMVLSMEVGNVLYFFRVPMGFLTADLMRIASTLSP